MKSLGGGKKKLTLKQLEKARAKRSKRKETKSSSKTGGEKVVAGIIPPNPKDEKVISELKKMKVFTPYTVASRFNIRLSVARSFLKELESHGTIQFVSGNKRIRIYKPAD